MIGWPVLPIVAASLAVLPAMPAAGMTAAPPVVTCRIEGWSIDPDPHGLIVRAGPTLGAREIGRLPAFVRDDDGDYGPAFAITGSSGGWLRIERANDAWRPADLPRRPVFAGSGWVHGSRVRLAVQSATGRGRPSANAPVTVSTGKDWLSEAGEITGVLGCSGNWAEVGYAIPAKQPVRGRHRGTAWFERTCGDQRTTCETRAPISS